MIKYKRGVYELCLRMFTAYSRFKEEEVVGAQLLPP
jgi:hypothetical protein